MRDERQMVTEEEIRLIRDAIKFFVWAAGEGLSTTDEAVPEPETTLFQYATATGDEDYDGYADRIAAALPLKWAPTHRHRKGGEYRIVRRGRLEWNLEDAVIYESQYGHVWVRPAAEFDDGRFTAIRAGNGEE